MEWILCDERLPKEGQMVLTTIRGHDVIIVQDEETFEEAIERVWNEVCYVSVGFIGSDGWYGADGYPLIVHPIAWMPLPKPYRKTENSSEKPNNCEQKNYCDDCLYTDTCDSKEFFYACTSKATISKMEQVDKDINVRSKNEPHIVGKHADAIIIDDSRLTAKCLNCANGSSYKCSKCDGEMYYKYDKDEPQNCENCKHNGVKHAYDYACDKCTDMDKWECDAEPQTDCAWMKGE